MRQDIYAGLKDSVIFGVSFIFLYLAIGANGLNNGLSLFQTLSSTLFVFFTPLQFLLTQSYQEGYILIPLILAMNARFFADEWHSCSLFCKNQTDFFVLLKHSDLPFCL